MINHLGGILMSIQSQKKNMQTIYGLVLQDLGYIYGEREDGFNGAKKQFHTKSAAFLRTLGNDLGFKEFKVTNNHGGIAISGEITLMGMWGESNGLYFQINQPIQPFNSFLYRSIKHMRDYSGGTNQWIPCDLFATGEYEKLIDTVLALRNTFKEVERHVA
jgi:hypothetical protein